MNSEIFDEIELDNDEVTETTVVSDRLYIPLGNPKTVKQIPLAFTVPDNLPPVTVEGFILAWTKEALGEFSAIQNATKNQDNSSVKNLPYASLRGLLEVGLDGVARIQSNLGLSQFDLSAKNQNSPQPFVYLNGGRREEISKKLRSILNEWIANFLQVFAEKVEVSPEVIDRLQELRENNELLKIRLKSQVLPWEFCKETGTTKAKGLDYRILIDYIASQIAGKEIFQGLGSMKRVISSDGSFTTGMAELITNPISQNNEEANNGKFSLVLRLEVVTIPSLKQPLLKIDVSKRRWLNELNPPEFNSKRIGGFVFSEDYQDRAFSYKLIPQQDKQQKAKTNQKKKDFWSIDKDFEALQRKLKLPTKTPNGDNIDGQQIALGKASTENCKVMLTYSNGLQDSKHGIEAGVPEIDKLEAFEKIAEILESTGFIPFEDYSTVKIKGESHKLDDTVSRMINLPTLLSAILEVIESENNINFTENYLEELSDEQLSQLLSTHFGFDLQSIVSGRKSLKFGDKKTKPQMVELQAMIEKNQAIMDNLHGKNKPLLLIFYEEKLQTDLKLLKAIINLIWGGKIDVKTNRLPENTHGPRELLPGSKFKQKERSRRRIQAWDSTVQQLAERPEKTFCLVMAREWYPDTNSENKYKHDDRVNKPSTRQALAQMADCRVQFILPIEKTKKDKFLQLSDFFHRAQAALKDLLFAHYGYIEDVQEKVDKWLKDIPEENRPKEIIGITIVRKQKGRARGHIGTTFLPVAMRLKVKTGECELCCAYEKGNTWERSPWSKFADGITYISKISPVKLADKQEIREARFMEFVREIISTSVEEENHPLVMIDSSNCVQLWRWLADVRIDPNNINLAHKSGSPLYEHLEQEWKNARIIRIRQDIAPGIIDKKVRNLAETTLDDTRRKEELKTTLEIPSASSATKLFKLKNQTNKKSEINQKGCVAYLSVGRKTLHQKSRGQSCYHQTKIHRAKKLDGSDEKVLNQAGLEVHQLEARSPFTGQYPTPNPLEIVVTLRQAEDNPDSLAALVESLRYGFGHYSDWSSLPAPLFFERVIRDYISEFAMEDGEIDGEDDLEE